MKKFTEILSFILTAIFVVGGLVLAIGAVGAVIELFSYSPSSGLEELLSVFLIPVIILGIIIVGLFAVGASLSGLTAFLLIRTADKKFDGNENIAIRIILKCIAYGLLILTVIQFAKFFS